MEMCWFSDMLLLLVLVYPAMGDREDRSVRTDQISKLLSRMSPDERPPGPPTQVSVAVNILHVHDCFPGKPKWDMEVTLTLWFQLKWTDVRMARYQTDDRNRLVISADKVWTPDVVVLNALKPPGLIYDGHVTYSSIGEATLVRTMLVTTSSRGSSVRGELFPSRSSWVLEVGSLTYNSDEQRLEKVDHLFGHNIEWLKTKGFAFDNIEKKLFTIDGMKFDHLEMTIIIYNVQ